MPRTICIANQKGGVGKTTTAINLAAGLARAGKLVLLIDLDPQCNATTGLAQQPVEQHPLMDPAPLRQRIIPDVEGCLHLVPGCRRYRDVQSLAAGDAAAAESMLGHLRHGTGRFDFVILDSPPSAGPMTRGALAASDQVLMPIQCEYFAMEGLAQMIQVVRHVIRTHNQRLEFGGILLTMYDERLELTAEVDRQVREFFGDIVFQTAIPRDVAVAEAPSHGQSVMRYAPRSRGAWAYTELCMEVTEHDP